MLTKNEALYIALRAVKSAIILAKPVAQMLKLSEADEMKFIAKLVKTA